MRRGNIRGHELRQFHRFGGPVVALLLLVGAVTQVSAHQPWFNEEGSPDPVRPYRLPSALEISQVIYGGLATSGAVDYYTFTAPDQFNLSMYLVTADAEACAEFRPVFAVMGPGISGSIDTTLAPPLGMPSLAEGSGVTVVGGDQWEVLRDGQLSFVMGPRLEQQLPGGTYLVAVYDPEGETGVYGLTTNGEEVVTLPEGFWAKIEGWNQCESVSVATPAP